MLSMIFVLDMEEDAITYADFIELFDWGAELIRRNVTDQNGVPYHSHIIGVFYVFYCHNLHRRQVIFKTNISQTLTYPVPFVKQLRDTS